MLRTSSHTARIITAAVVLLTLVLAVYASTYLSQQSVLTDLVSEWGYVAVLIAAIISGLNAIVPIPAATLTPVFTAAGLALPGIVVTLVIGTVIADFIGYLLGSSTKDLVTKRYPKLTSFIGTLANDHTNWIAPFVIMYAAFMPFPNEAILIPLAFAGVRFGRLVLPLLIGGTIHQLLLVYGTAGLADLFS